MEAEFLDLMPDTITIAPSTGAFTDRGQPSVGVAVSYRCRIEPVEGERIIRSSSGEERKAAWVLYVNATTFLDPEGQLTLPVGFVPRTPPFYAIGRQADESGSHHVVIHV